MARDSRLARAVVGVVSSLRNQYQKMITVGSAGEAARLPHMRLESLESRTLFVATMLSGAPVGTQPAVTVGVEYDKATDGNPATYFNYGLASGGWAGIDLGDGNERELSKVRFLPMTGFESKFVGGKIQGSNTGPNSGYVDLHTIASQPARGWTEVTLSGAGSYRWYRYLSPANSYARLSEVEFYTDNSANAPAAPTNLTATAGAAGQAVLNWADNATNETGYRVERRVGPGGAWAALIDLPAGSRRYTDSGLLLNRDYHYRISALNAADDWSYSNTATVRLPSTSTKLTGSPFGVSPPNAVGNEFDKAYDGITGTAYTAATPSGAYTGIDLGSGPAPTVTHIRFFPMWGFEYRMVGGRFQGSNAGPTSGFVDLATISSTPARGWNEIPIDGAAGYRWLRYLGPNGGYSSVAEVEFYTSQASTFSGVNLTVAGLGEQDEESVGRFLPVNQNGDEDNRDANGNPRLDNHPDASAGDRVVFTDPDLMDATLSLDGTAGRWMLEFPDRIRVWRETSPNVYVPVESGVESDLVQTAGIVYLKIEGINNSSALRDVDLRAVFAPTSGAAVEDTVRLTVATADLDIDSDSDDRFEAPEFDSTEERLEEDPSEPGKITYLNDNDSDGDGIVDWADGFNYDGLVGNNDDATSGERFVPLSIFVAGSIDLSTARVRISYSGSDPAALSNPIPPGGHLRLWTKDGSQSRNKASVGAGGDYVSPGEHLASDLDFSGREATLWIEAVAETGDDLSRTIKIEVDPDGNGPEGFVLVDSVLVTAEHVASLPGTIRGYKWWDKNEDGVRNGEFLKTPPDTIFVIDVSGSTAEHFRSQQPIGNVNGDGHDNSVLDGEIAAFRALNQHLVDEGYGDTRVGIVVFGTSAAILDLDPIASGLQSSIAPGAALDAILAGLQISEAGVGTGTNYEAALQQAVPLGRQLYGSGRHLNVFFVSDGYPKDSSKSAYLDDVARLRTDLGAHVRAFGAGLDASGEHLQAIDENYRIFETADPLIAAFDGSVAEAANFTEPAIAGWQVTAFVDADNDRVLDENEQRWTTQTEPDGWYSLSLPAGTYVVIEEGRPGWMQTAPGTGYHVVTVGSEEVETVHFGNTYAPKVNLVVDSDDNNGSDLPDNSEAEETLEDTQGKPVFVNNTDPDQDGIPGVADLDSVGTVFTPMLVDLEDLSAGDFEAARLSFDYNGSDPSGIAGDTPADGVLRIWTKAGSAARVVVDYVEPGKPYPASAFGLDAANRTVTLWVEAIRRTTDLSDGRIQLNVDLDGAGPTNTNIADVVHFRVDEVTPGRGTLQGHFFRDRNRNTQWDQQLIAGEKPDVILVIDASGSATAVGMWGEGVGDINNDGFGDLNGNGVIDGGERDGGALYLSPNHLDIRGRTATTVLDAEIAGGIALNQHLIDLGFGDVSNVAVIAFGTQQWQIDMRPDLPGLQATTTPGADLNANGVLDVVEGLKSIRADNFQTNPDFALGKAVEVLDGWATDPSSTNIYLLSDGFYGEGEGVSPAGILRGHGVNLRAFAVGNISGIDRLREIDPQASRLLRSEDVLLALAGTGGQVVPEEGLGGWTVHVDLDRDGQVDAGEPTTVTASDGSYEFTNVAAGLVRVRMIQADGWLQTAPRIATGFGNDYSTAQNFYDLTLSDGETLSKLNFGVIEDVAAPAADGIVFDPSAAVNEGSTLQVTVNNPAGFTQNGQFPLVYSFDLNNDGDFIDTGDVYRSSSPTTTMPMYLVGDGPTSVPTASVRVRIHDAFGNETDIESTTTIDVENVAPLVSLPLFSGSYDLASFFEDGAPIDAPIRGTFSDNSAADASAAFTVEWTLAKDSQIIDQVSGQTAPGARDTIYSFVPSAGAGVYTLTFAVTDKDGGRSEISRTITITRAAPFIEAVSAGNTPITGTDATLSVTATDDDGEANLIYYWDVDRRDDVVSSSLAKVGTNAAKSLDVTFLEPGDYTFTVYAVDADGNVDSSTLQVAVAATATSLQVGPAEAVVAANGGTQTFDVTVLDQFGNPITPPSAPQWSIVGGSPVGSIDPDTGDYTSSTTYGTDTIQVQVGTLTATVKAHVPDPAQQPIYGAASDFSVAEGQGFGNSSTNGQGLAGFVDSLANTVNGDYTATIDWDINDSDPTTEPGQIRSDVVNGVRLFEVVAAHQYEDPGTYTFRVTLTHTGTSRSLQVDGTVSVAAAGGHNQFVIFNPVRDQQFQGPVVRFTSDDPTDTADEFTATIDWGDGAGPTSQGVDVIMPATGQFQVTGTNTYDTLGSKNVVVTVSKNGTPLFNRGGTVQVLPEALAAPTITKVDAVSQSILYIEWTQVPDAYGYILWATNNTTGEKRRIPDGTGVKDGWPVEADPGKRWTVDQYLPSGTSFTYTIQTVYEDGSTSAESAPATVSTLSDKQPAKPLNASGQHVTVESDNREEEQGIKLRWSPAEVGGYRVFRKQLNASTSEPEWIDLISGQATPFSTPDWTGTVQPINGLYDLLDPTAPEADGMMGFFDAFASGLPSEPIEYAIVAYDVQSSQGTPLVASQPAFVEVLPDTAGPSQPTNVKVASYPQAMQLTWDDRPETDTDWDHWDAYRLNPATQQWVKLNSQPIRDLGFNDITAPVGQVSEWRVIAVDTVGNESAPVTVSGRRALNGQPQNPGSLIGRSNGQGSIRLQWDAVVPIQHLGHPGDALDHYQIYRKLPSESEWTPVGQSQTSQFDDQGLTSSTEYEYHVTAVDVDGDESLPSATVTVSTGNGIAPADPVDPLAEQQGTTSIELQWEAGTGGDATTGFRIYRSKKADSGFVLVAEVNAAASEPNTFIDAGLRPATQYFYRIYAVDADGDVSGFAAATDTTNAPLVNSRPVVALTNVSGSGTGPTVISKDTAIRGIVDDPDGDLDRWTLLLRPVSATGTLTDIVLASGGDEVGEAATGESAARDGEIAQLQPTLWPDGLYELVLTARDGDPESVSTNQLIRIKSDVKLGNFTLPVVDLQIDVPGGQPIVVRRVYDSSQSHENGDFGYGWRLDLSDTDLRTTARDSERQPGSGKTALRYGDLVYITLPGGQQHAFQFVPKPTNYEQGIQWPLLAFDPTHLFYAGSGYEPKFIAVDGSNATLRINHNGFLRYDRDRQEFVGQLNDEPFNPASSAFGGIYELSTTDGSTYTVDANTGRVTSSTDANGNRTNYAIGSVSSGNRKLTIERDDSGRIKSISDGAGQIIAYEYDPVTGDLIKVTDAVGKETLYHYDDVDHPHYLTRVTDPRGVDVVNVSYDESGKVEALADATDGAASLGYGGFDGTSGSHGVSDLAGNGTEMIYNDRGDVIREIREIRENGQITGYMVTVREYRYYTNVRAWDLSDMVLYGRTNLNKRMSQVEYQPFEIDGADPNGARYSQKPTAVAQSITYHFLEDVRSDDLGLPASVTTYASDGTTPRTTMFSDYKLGKPQTIVDPYGNVTKNHYDNAGNLEWTENALGEKTYFLYTNGGPHTYSNNGGTVDYSALPKGMLLETYQIRNGVQVVLSRNVYYGNDASVQNFGRLKSTTDAAGLTTRYTYTLSGNVEAVFREWTDAQGFHSVLDSHTEYDAAGRVTKVTDANGKSTQTVYNDIGQVDRTVDPYNGETKYFYDVRGNLIRTLYPDGTETRTVYDKMGRAAWTTDRYDTTGSGVDNTTTARATQTIYDSLGRVEETRRYKDVLVKIEDDPDVSVAGIDRAVIVDANDNGLPDGATKLSDTKTEFDSKGRVSATVNADGLRTETEYYPNGQVKRTRQVPAVGDPTSWTVYDYDRFNVSRVTVSGAIESGGTFAIRFTDISGDDQATVMVTASGDATSVLTALAAAINDSTDPLFAQVQATVSNGALHLAAAAGHDDVRYLAYVSAVNSNSNGNVPTIAAQSSFRSEVVTDALGHTTVTVYDALGRATKTIFHDDSFAETIYSVGDESAEHADVALPTGFPAALTGQHVIKIEQRRTGDPAIATHYLYDESGRLTDVWLPAVLDEEPSSPTYNQMVRPHWGYEYDANGNQIAQVDPKLNRTEFTYDEFGRRTLRTLPLGVASSNDADDFVERFEYDALGRQSLHVSFEGRVTQFVYDNSTATGGRLLEKRLYDTVVAYDDGAGAPSRTITYSYDNLGRVEEIDDSAAASPTIYGYDDKGRQTRATDANGKTVHHEYDEATGRLVRTYTGSLDADRTSTSGDGKAITDTRYGYDGFGRLQTVSVHERHDTPLVTPEASTYHYDAAGNLDKVQQSNGMVSDYDYDDLNRLETLVHFDDADDDLVLDAGETVHGKFEYELNPNGTRSQVTETNALGETVIQWTYDGLNRLTGESYNAPGTANDYSTSYHFDLASNRVKKETDHGNDGVDETIAYTYDANDRLLTETKNDLVDDADDTHTVYGYNVTEQTSKRMHAGSNAQGTLKERISYEYDQLGRLKQVTIDSDGDQITDTTISYAYDDSGIRVSQTVTEGSTTKNYEYVVDAKNPTGYQQVLEEHVNGTLAKTYTLGHDVLTQHDATSGPLTFLYDGHGSTRALLDSLLAVQQRYAYDAYGNLLPGTGLTITNTLTNLLYSGEQFDAKLGMQYLRARYYNPHVGRFGASDRFWGDTNAPLSLHKYIYGHNNPILLSDPSGNRVDPYTSSAGIQVHALFSAYANVVRQMTLAGAPLAVVLPDLFANSQLGTLKPDLVDPEEMDYFELKTIKHSRSATLKEKDATQMGRYDHALQPHGFSRGDPQTLAPSLAGILLGFISDRGKVYEVQMYPATDYPKMGYDNMGFLYYTLTEVKNGRRKPVPVPVPVARPYGVSDETLANITLAVTAGVAVGGGYLLASAGSKAIAAGALNFVFAAIGLKSATRSVI